MSEVKSKLSELIEASLRKIKDLAESDTIVGKPITTPDGTTILPVSKISVGVVNGGLDYSGKRRAKDGAKEYSDGEPHFGGGGGAGISMSPIAFLVVSPEGKVDLIPLTPSPAAASSSVDRIASLIERSPEILEKAKSVFSKKKSANGDDCDSEKEIIATPSDDAESVE